MTGRPARGKPPRWQQRMASAGTPQEELEVAFDRLRSALASNCRKRRDADAARRDETAAAIVARETTSYLIHAAMRLEARARDGDAA